MKVGIITITNGENYGNRLQNYAVQEALKDSGIEAETIHKITNVFDAENHNYIRKLKLKKILHYHLTVEERRRLNFYRFTKRYIKKAHFVIDNAIPQGLENAYDYFIAGSDQVWNPYLDYCTPANFLTFTKSYKKIAFAPSIAVTEIPEDLKDNFRKWIGDFRLLSVREESGAKIIEKLCGRAAEVLFDPTLYLSADRWRKIERKPDFSPSPKKYLLQYFLGKCSKEYKKIIEGYASKNHLEIVQLQTKEHYDIAPDEFLYLIDHAALVCTDSFHGTVFSIIFKTNFVVFYRMENFADMGSRIDTLLKKFSMENRYQTEINDDDLMSTDFSGTDTVIEKERLKTKNFLSKIDKGERYA